MVFSVDFPDPFARVIFLNQSDSTEKLEKTLCPTWDQTLMFEEIEIHGQPESIMEKPPKVVVEIFDYDNFVSVDWNNKPPRKGEISLGYSFPLWNNYNHDNFHISLSSYPTK